ncbi:MAG: hypothetical protein AAB706_00565 [Patescibacteria group bacterium]
MNKKGVMEMYVGAIVNIVLLMTMIITIYNPQQFKITKQVCEQETAYNQTLIEKTYETRDELDSLGGRNSGESLSVEANLCDEFSYLNISYCEEYKEKQSLLVKKLIEIDREILNNPVNKTTCHDEEVDEIKVKEGDFYPTGTYEAFVSKQDLTVKWLDENAICLIRGEKGDNIFSYDCEKGGVIDVNINETPRENCSYLGMVGDGGKCSKYKLGNYTIEVLQ